MTSKEEKVMVHLKYILTLFICLTLLSCGSDEAGTTNINNENNDGIDSSERTDNTDTSNTDNSNGDISSDISETSNSMDATISKITVKDSGGFELADWYIVIIKNLQ